MILVNFLLSSNESDSVNFILLLIKSTTSWLLREFQMPSQAKNTNVSVSGCKVSFLTSGTGEIICC